MRGAKTTEARSRALVFVGDAMEEELDELCAGAGELGLRSVPAFMFQEGYDPVCEQAFREIARLTRGAYCRFAPGAAHELAELLRAAAAYAAGGMKALAELQARHRRDAPHSSSSNNKAVMPFLLGVVVLVLLLWAGQLVLEGRSQAGGETVAAARRRCGVAVCRLSLFRGEIGPRDYDRCHRARRARLAVAVAGELWRRTQKSSGQVLAGALGFCRDGARSRQRHDARPHPGRAL